MTEARSEDDDGEGELNTQEHVDDDDSDDEGTDSSSDDNNDEEDEEEDPEDTKRSSESNRLAASMKGEGDEPCSFDLRNLLGINSHTVNTAALYQKGEQEPSRVTISSNLQINEDYLFQKAQQGCHQLLKSLWKLPQEQSDVGALVTLPTFEDSRLPRALPLPPPRVETKWEKFAKEKGIGINQSKRSRKVWDEATNEWMYRTGYQKAGAKPESWPIREADPKNPYADPWQADRKAQEERVTKNTSQRLKNVERAGGMEKGTTNRLLAGVPVDLPAAGRKGNADVVTNGQQQKQQHRGQASTLAALRATQRSTASLGNFDRLREGEPERKQPRGAKTAPKRKAPASNAPAQTEQQRSLHVLNSMSRVDTKAKQQGRLATGETAYDYDYEDGLGPATFRKRKGRAGAGKMKKMTKKRAK